MTLQPPPGQGPIDPRGAFSPPPPPGQAGGETGSPPPPPRSYPGAGFQPPMLPPPAAFPPPPPPSWYPPSRPRRSFAGAIFTTLATTIFAVSIILNIYLLAYTGLFSGRSSRQTVLVEGDAKNQVAVIPIVNSMILEAQARQLDQMLEMAEKDDTIKAVVLRIDTPGGAVTAADEMYHRIEAFKTKRPGVPVVVAMGGTAASGGYYAACAADYLFAQPTTITGSIGVLLPQYNFSKFGEKYGIEDTSLHATGTPYKTAGSWLKPPSPDDTKYLVGLIDGAFARFKSVVTAGRGKKLTQPLDAIANGKAYTADEALALGLVDQIGYLPDAYTYAESKAGLKNMQVVQYEQPSSLVDLLMSSRSNVPPAQSRDGVQINGVNINAADLQELLTPRLLYMWRGN